MPLIHQAIIGNLNCCAYTGQLPVIPIFCDKFQCYLMQVTAFTAAHHALLQAVAKADKLCEETA